MAAVFCLQWVAGFFARKRRFLVIKFQILPYLMYTVLSWMSRAVSHSWRLQHPAIGATISEPNGDGDSQLCRFTRAPQGRHGTCFPQVTGAGTASPGGPTQDTRMLLFLGDAVEVPRSRTSQRQPTFVNSYPNVECVDGHHPTSKR